MLSWLKRQDPVWVAAVVLAILYTGVYLGYPNLPGNNAAFPAGWWGWWDQSNYLKSAVALAHVDFNPDQHLYPLGYALMGAPFARMAPLHPFYFVDLASLLVSLAAFVSFAGRCGVRRRWAALLFVLAAAGDPVLFEQWVVPWTTTPLTAAVWLLLAVAAAHLDGVRRPGLLGLVAVTLPMLRPADLLLTLPALATCLLVDLRRQRLRWRDVAVFGAAVLVPAGLYLALHVAIYGFKPSYYMVMSAEIGFTLYDFGWKAYVVLVDPTAWIGGGEGLLRRVPWLILGVAGLLPALRRPLTAMLAVTLVLHSTLYLAYVDLLPTGFWRYLNVHYWTWAFPGFALLGVLLVRDLVWRGRRMVAAGALAGVLALLCIHLDPLPARDGAAIDAVDFTLANPPFDATYFGQIKVHDAVGTQSNIQQVRAIPMPDGVRILALTRAMRGTVTATGDGLDALTAVPLHGTPRLGLPFWPWRRADEMYGPR